MYKENVSGYLESLNTIINQTERRVLNNEKVESKDKLVSVFETHTDILAKGKRETIFGHKILLSGGENNLILDCMIERGNWSDANNFTEGIDRLKEKYGYLPEEITTDGGFASKDNYDYAVGEGIKKVIFTKNISSKMVEPVKTSRAYKKLKKGKVNLGSSFRTVNVASNVSCNLVCILCRDKAKHKQSVLEKKEREIPFDEALKNVKEL